MIFYKHQSGEVLSVRERCHLEADQGRVSLALSRIRELDEEYPDHPKVLYAIGQMHLEHLGAGMAARPYFKRAHDLALKQCPEAETAWFCTCNLVATAPTADERRAWVRTAVQERGPQQEESQSFSQDLAALDGGTPYSAILADHYFEYRKEEDYGHAAAAADVLLRNSPDLQDEMRLSFMKERMLCLRRLDDMAAQKRQGLTEVIPSDERLTLQAALEECARAIELDPYDPVLWNYRSAWSVALQRYEEAIEYADRAISLRPQDYSRPHHNRATALWPLGRRAEALASAREALNQAQSDGLGPEVAEEARQLVTLYSSPPPTNTLAAMMPWIARIVACAHQTCERDIQRFGGAIPLSAVVDRLFSHYPTVKQAPFKGYVPMMAELLMMFTPETAFVASLNLSQEFPNSSLVEYFLVATSYVACHSTGVLRRDAARYLLLMTFAFPKPDAIRKYYRQAFLATSADASGPLASGDALLRQELGRIHPELPALIADQPPLRPDELAAAQRNIVRHYQ